MHRLDTGAPRAGWTWRVRCSIRGQKSPASARRPRALDPGPKLAAGGEPLWVSGARPGHEHDTTCAKAAAGLLPALEVLDAGQRIPTLTDLGYVSVFLAIRHLRKKPKGGELTEAQTTYNQVICGVHGIGGRADSLFKTTFKVLRRVSLCAPGVLARSPKPPSSYSTSNTTGPSPAATPRENRLPGMVHCLVRRHPMAFRPAEASHARKCYKTDGLAAQRMTALVRTVVLADQISGIRLPWTQLS